MLLGKHSVVIESMSEHPESVKYCSYSNNYPKKVTEDGGDMGMNHPEACLHETII